MSDAISFMRVPITPGASAGGDKCVVEDPQVLRLTLCDYPRVVEYLPALQRYAGHPSYKASFKFIFICSIGVTWINQVTIPSQPPNPIEDRLSSFAVGVRLLGGISDTVYMGLDITCVLLSVQPLHHIIAFNGGIV